MTVMEQMEERKRKREQEQAERERARQQKQAQAPKVSDGMTDSERRRRQSAQMASAERAAARSQDKTPTVLSSTDKATGTTTNWSQKQKEQRNPRTTPNARPRSMQARLDKTKDMGARGAMEIYDKRHGMDTSGMSQEGRDFLYQQRSDAYAARVQSGNASDYDRTLAGYANPTMREAGHSFSDKKTEEMDYADKVAYYERYREELPDNFLEMLEKERNTPSSRHYDPYSGRTSTNKEAMEMFGRDTFDDDFFEQNRGLLDVLQFNASNTSPLSPTKKGARSTPEYAAAYKYWHMLDDEDNTKSAEEEMRALRTQIQDQADYGASADEIYEDIYGDDFKRNYPTLYKMGQMQDKGTYMLLNRPVNAGRDNVRAIINAATRGEDVTKDRDFMAEEIDYRLGRNKGQVTQEQLAHMADLGKSTAAFARWALDSGLTQVKDRLWKPFEKKEEPAQTVPAEGEKQGGNMFAKVGDWFRERWEDASGQNTLTNAGQAGLQAFGDEKTMQLYVAQGLATKADMEAVIAQKGAEEAALAEAGMGGGSMKPMSTNLDGYTYSELQAYKSELANQVVGIENKYGAQSGDEFDGAVEAWKAEQKASLQATMDDLSRQIGEIEGSKSAKARGGRAAREANMWSFTQKNRKADEDIKALKAQQAEITRQMTQIDQTAAEDVRQHEKLDAAIKEVDKGIEETRPKTEAEIQATSYRNAYSRLVALSINKEATGSLHERVEMIPDEKRRTYEIALRCAERFSGQFVNLDEITGYMNAVADGTMTGDEMRQKCLEKVQDNMAHGGISYVMYQRMSPQEQAAVLEQKQAYVESLKAGYDTFNDMRGDADFMRLLEIDRHWTLEDMSVEEMGLTPDEYASAIRTLDERIQNDPAAQSAYQFWKTLGMPMTESEITGARATLDMYDTIEAGGFGMGDLAMEIATNGEWQSWGMENKGLGVYETLTSGVGMGVNNYLKKFPAAALWVVNTTDWAASAMRGLTETERSQLATDFQRMVQDMDDYTSDMMTQFSMEGTSLENATLPIIGESVRMLGNVMEGGVLGQLSAAANIDHLTKLIQSMPSYGGVGATEYAKKYMETGNHWGATTYGGLMAAIEAATEGPMVDRYITSVFGDASKEMAVAGLKKASQIWGEAGLTWARNTILNMNAEGIQEVLSGALDAAVDYGFDVAEAGWDFSQGTYDYDERQALNDYWGGFSCSLIFGVASLPNYASSAQYLTALMQENKPMTTDAWTQLAAYAMEDFARARAEQFTASEQANEARMGREEAQFQTDYEAAQDDFVQSYADAISGAQELADLVDYEVAIAQTVKENPNLYDEGKVKAAQKEEARFQKEYDKVSAELEKATQEETRLKDEAAGYIDAANMGVMSNPEAQEQIAKLGESMDANRQQLTEIRTRAEEARQQLEAAHNETEQATEEAARGARMAAAEMVDADLDTARRVIGQINAKVRDIITAGAQTTMNAAKQTELYMESFVDAITQEPTVEENQQTEYMNKLTADLQKLMGQLDGTKFAKWVWQKTNAQAAINAIQEAGAQVRAEKQESAAAQRSAEVEAERADVANTGMAGAQSGEARTALENASDAALEGMDARTAADVLGARRGQAAAQRAAEAEGARGDVNGAGTMQGQMAEAATVPEGANDAALEAMEGRPGGMETRQQQAAAARAAQVAAERGDVANTGAAEGQIGAARPDVDKAGDAALEAQEGSTRAAEAVQARRDQVAGELGTEMARGETMRQKQQTAQEAAEAPAEARTEQPERTAHGVLKRAVRPAMERIADNIIGATKSTIDKARLVQGLEETYDALDKNTAAVETDETFSDYTPEELDAQTRDIGRTLLDGVARDVLGKVRRTSRLFGGDKVVRDAMREMTFWLNPKQVAEIESKYGSVAAWKRANKGHFKVTQDKSKMSLDQAYAEMHEMYPAYFPEAADADQPAALARAWNMAMPTKTSNVDIDAEAGGLVDEIIDAITEFHQQQNGRPFLQAHQKTGIPRNDTLFSLRGQENSSVTASGTENRGANRDTVGIDPATEFRPSRRAERAGVKRPSQIGKELVQALDITATRKNQPKALRGKNPTAEGVYETHPGVVVTSAAQNIRALAHEIGHAVFSRSGAFERDGITPVAALKTDFDRMADKLPADFKKRYTDAGQKDALYQEAGAEFMTRLLTDRNAATNFAGEDFVNWFERNALTDNRQRAAVQKARAEINSLLNAEGVDRARALVVSERDNVSHRHWYNKAISAVADKYHFAIRFDKSAAELGYKNKDASRQTYTYFSNLNYSAQQAMNILERGLYSPDGRRIAGSFVEQISEFISSADREDFDTYLLLLNDVDRQKQGKPIFPNNTAESSAEQAQLLADKHPEFKQAQQALLGWWNQFIDTWVVEPNIIPKAREKIAKFRKMYPNYAPSFRSLADNTDLMTDVLPDLGGVLARSGVKFKGAKGSDLAIISPVESFAKRVSEIVAGTNKTLAMRQLYDVYKQTPGLNEYMRELPDLSKKISDQRKQIAMAEKEVQDHRDKLKELKEAKDKEKAKHFDEETKEWTDFEGYDKYRKQYLQERDAEGELFENARNALEAAVAKLQKLMQKPEIARIVDSEGKEHFFQIMDQEMYDALNLSTPDLGAVATTIGKFTSGFKALTTMKHPFFAISNAMRDFAESYAKGSSLFVGDHLIDQVKAFAEVMVSELPGIIGKSGYTTEMLGRYYAQGGGDTSIAMNPGGKGINTLQSATYKKYLRDEVRRVFTPGNIRKNLQAVKDVSSYLWGHKFFLGILDTINDAVETSQRYAEFKRQKGLGTVNTVLKALGVERAAVNDQAAFRAAMDVTTDFARSGNSTTLKRAGQVFAFMNAGIQGSYTVLKLASQAKLDKGKFAAAFIKAAALFAALPVWLRTKYREDEDDERAYQAMADNVKQDIYLIPAHWFGISGDRDYFIKIPKPNGLMQMMGGAVGQSIITMLDHEGGWEDFITYEMPELMQTIATQGVDAIYPFSSPVFASLYQLWNNTSWYGSPIEPDYLSDLSPSKRYTDTTSNVGMWLANLPGLRDKISPIQADYFINQQFGILGDLALSQAGDAVVDAMNGKGTWGGAWNSALGTLGDMIRSRVRTDPSAASDSRTAVSNAIKYFSGMKADRENDKKKGIEWSSGRLNPKLTRAEMERAYKELEQMATKGGVLYTAKKKASSSWDEIEKIEKDGKLTEQEKVLKAHDVKFEMVMDNCAALEVFEMWQDMYVRGTPEKYKRLRGKRIGVK